MKKKTSEHASLSPRSSSITTHVQRKSEVRQVAGQGRGRVRPRGAKRNGSGREARACRNTVRQKGIQDGDGRSERAGNPRHGEGKDAANRISKATKDASRWALTGRVTRCDEPRAAPQATNARLPEPGARTCCQIKKMDTSEQTGERQRPGTSKRQARGGRHGVSEPVERQRPGIRTED
jgi:hypothetical protein